MDTIARTITNLNATYEATAGRTTRTATLRRSAAMDALTAALFVDINQQLDPFRQDDVNDDIAGETLGFAQLVCDTLVTTLLDYRECAEATGYAWEDYRERLEAMLLDVSNTASRDLMDG